MLRIRPEQMEEFSKAAVKNFEDRMVVHLKQFFPDHCQVLKETGIREAIQHGIQQAAQYKIVSERDVCKYIDLMFAFGRDYDKDTELPWAEEILNDPAMIDPTTKINRLYDTAMKQVRQTGGIDKEREP